MVDLLLARGEPPPKVAVSKAPVATALALTPAPTPAPTSVVAAAVAVAVTPASGPMPTMGVTLVMVPEFPVVFWFVAIATHGLSPLLLLVVLL
ncbi:MAG: hypothetical protein QNJ97_16275 [Myxococcota bacterium]|nr:hypothetical protein [Myxococcota bacterium]